MIEAKSIRSKTRCWPPTSWVHRKPNGLYVVFSELSSYLHALAIFVVLNRMSTINLSKTITQYVIKSQELCYTGVIVVRVFGGQPSAEAAVRRGRIGGVDGGSKTTVRG